ncbi:MAG: hypothetical protein HC906_10590 [Bacteroidales bacterium]|nr:hypothetical protein [Bacteroidales bacterium]
MECRGACMGIEDSISYNQRAEKLLKSLTMNCLNSIILDRGRNINEYAVIKIENGKYIGFGYMDKCECISHPAEVDLYIEKHHDNRDIQAIIRHFINNGKIVKKIDY